MKKQPKTAFLYYSIAASMAHENSLLKLAECYRNGFGTEQDLREAVRNYEKAAQSSK